MPRFIASVAFLALTGCGFPGIPVPTNQASFREFEFKSEPALGFCVEPNEIIGALIKRDSNSLGTIALTAVGQIDESLRDPLGECMEGSIATNAGCALVVNAQERELTSNEVDEIQRVFKVVWTRQGRLSFFVDPCRIDSYRWDSFQPDLTRAEKEQIRDLLHSLNIE